MKKIGSILSPIAFIIALLTLSAFLEERANDDRHQSAGKAATATEANK